jgi:SEC-C motif-containing protein
MRSRYAAFALGLAEYLVETLASGHPDRELPRGPFLQELSRARDRQRFMGLRILFATTEPKDDGEIMFYARIFEKGTDRSFVELSQFVREDQAWRYASGIVVPAAELPADLGTLAPEDVRRRDDSSDAE